MPDPFYLRQPFSEKIRTDEVVLPGGWHIESEDELPSREERTRSLDAYFSDARRRWQDSAQAALEPLFTLHNELTLHPCATRLVSLVYYATAFYDETGPEFEDAESNERWQLAIDAGLLDFCQQVISTDEVLSQIYQVIIECFSRANRKNAHGRGNSTGLSRSSKYSSRASARWMHV